MQSINPYTQKIIKNYENLNESEVQSRLNLAETAFRFWREAEFSQRADLMLKLAKNLEKEKDRD